MKTKEIRIRAIDCEQLNMQVIFVNNPSDVEQAKKNALMINAAPDLLSALICLVDCISETRGKYAADALMSAHAAIHKATSQQNNTSEK